jgi:hypothetical protein
VPTTFPRTTTAQNTPCVEAQIIRATTSIGYPTAIADISCDTARAATVTTTMRRRGQRRTNVMNGIVITATPYA